jgi:hypothetical protein
MRRLLYVVVTVLCLAVFSSGCTKTVMEELEDAHKKVSSSDSANCEQVASVMEKIPALMAQGVTEDQLTGLLEPMKQFCPETPTIAHNFISRIRKTSYSGSEIHFIAYIECANVLVAKNK